MGDGLLNWALSQAETFQLETKRVSGKVVGKALETVCAFANTDGGYLLLDVEDTTLRVSFVFCFPTPSPIAIEVPLLPSKSG
jgi:hypothetical protein